MQWNIMKLRKENKMSQKKVAELLGIHTVTYNAKELGKVVFTANELFILSQHFGVKIDDIFLPHEPIKNAKKEQLK